MSMGVLAIAAYVKGPGLGNLIFAGLARVGSPTAHPDGAHRHPAHRHPGAGARWDPGSASGDSPHRKVFGDRTIRVRRPTASSGVRIVLDHVSKVYPGSKRPAVDDVSLDIPAGEIVIFVGPSGCGKTTTMRMINRLSEPTSGRILIGDKDALSIKPTELQAVDRLCDPAGRPVPAHDDSAERRPGARPAAVGPQADRRPRRRTARPRRPRAGASTPTGIRDSFPAASSSGSGWPGRWPQTRRCC